MPKRRLRGFRPRGERLNERCLPSVYTPAQVVAAYGLGGFIFRTPSGATVAGDGAGQTIAIVDLYHDPNLQASLDAFDAHYNLPAVSLDVVDQAGTQTDNGWALEETLDVEWVHAIALAAGIDVVETSPGKTDDEQFANVLAGVSTAGSPGSRSSR
jgi:subtilase family serine protease